MKETRTMISDIHQDTRPKERINILHVIGTLDRGGAETFLMNMLRTIDRNKYNFVFLCFGNDTFDYEQEVTSLGGKICRIPAIDNRHLVKNITSVMRIIRAEKIDAIHSHIFYDSVFSMIAAKLAGVKVRIVHSHATKLDIKPNHIKRIYHLSAMKVINSLSTLRYACSDEAGRSLFGHSTFGIMHNGILLEDFYFNQEARNQIREKLNIASDAVVIGHIGRMDTLKNQSFAIDVFSEYFAINSNSYLVLVGDGVLKKSYEQKTKDLGLSDRIKFLGKRDDVNLVYNAMDLFIFPSLHEGLGMVLIEAQANGLKSLASDSIGSSVNLTDTVEFISLSLAPKLWASRISRMSLMRHNPKNKLIDSPYNMRISVKDIEKIYEEGA